MCLTTKTLHKLKEKDFHTLYNGSKDKYAAMAAYTVNFVKGRRRSSDRVLLGDVAEFLKMSVETDSDFEKHLDQNGLTPDSWPADFTDYILEQAYPQRDL